MVTLEIGVEEQIFDSTDSSRSEDVEGDSLDDEGAKLFDEGAVISRLGGTNEGSTGALREPESFVT